MVDIRSTVAAPISLLGMIPLLQCGKILVRCICSPSALVWIGGPATSAPAIAWDKSVTADLFHPRPGLQLCQMADLPPVPRIVTTHDQSGRSTVQIKDTIQLQPSDAFPGVKSRIIWTTESVPAKDNNEITDNSRRQPNGDLDIVQRGGTVCNMTDLAPGATATWHRTSSLDYNVLISGRLIHMLEDGTEQLIDQPGTVLVQKGTMHAWRNPGPDWARWVCVLVDAEPVVINGRRLEPGIASDTVC